MARSLDVCVLVTARNAGISAPAEETTGKKC
jgi:hypothetical protein